MSCVAVVFIAIVGRLNYENVKTSKPNSTRPAIPRRDSRDDKRDPKPPTMIVSFRLANTEFKKLGFIAKRSQLRSPQKVARQIVENTLSGGQPLAGLTV